MRGISSTRQLAQYEDTLGIIQAESRILTTNVNQRVKLRENNDVISININFVDL